MIANDTALNEPLHVYRSNETAQGTRVKRFYAIYGVTKPCAAGLGIMLFLTLFTIIGYGFIDPITSPYPFGRTGQHGADPVILSKN